jgi:hypothetical protein
MALAAFPKLGTTVQYHGSMQSHHGLYRVMGECECAECEEFDDTHRDISQVAPDDRYRLSLVNEYYQQLDHVRPSSVTIPNS